MNRMLSKILILSLVGASFVAGQALADSASLQSALQHLQAARNDLEATGRKNDEARQALGQVDAAIDNVRRGIEQERKKEQNAAREAERKQRKAAEQEQKSQERVLEQEQKAQEKAAEQERKAQEKAAEQARKAQKKAAQQGETPPTQ